MTVWNARQLDAITKNGKNMLVAAAAGSGKTAVLVERIIRKICDAQSGIAADRLFVVTFTEAAAAEMRHRLREALDARLLAEPGSAHLRKQLALLNRAQISTLHSFCNSVVQKYGYSIGLSPGFRIAGEMEMRLLMEEVMRNLLDDAFARRHQDAQIQQMLDVFTSDRDHKKLTELVIELFLFSRSQA